MGSVPKGPFRTKNTTTIAKIVNYYAVVFLLRPPNLVRRGPFLERKNVCNSQGNCVRTSCAAIVNHPAVLKILRVVNLLRVVFLVRRGPLGIFGGYFLGVQNIWPGRIYFFLHFSWKFWVGPFWGSAAGRGVLKITIEEKSLQNKKSCEIRSFAMSGHIVLSVIAL